jgi:Domain of unknown function (DUF1996)
MFHIIILFFLLENNIRIIYESAATQFNQDPYTSPSLDGFESIASNFNIADEIKQSQNKVMTAEDGTIGAFRFICQAGHLNWDDPIVYPGQIGGSPHLHQWYGNTLGNARSTYRSLRTSGESSCMGPLNRSAYWMPAMLNGSGQVVRPDYISIYYKRAPVAATECGKGGEFCRPLPRGLRYIFGYDMSRMRNRQTENQIFHWKCVTPQNTIIGGLSVRFGDLDCPAGNTLMVTMSSPDCWDGKNLDSKDHRSHVVHQRSSPATGRKSCPKSHPYLIPQFTIGAAYSIQSEELISKWFLSSDQMPGMPQLPAGESFHADWYGAWDDQAQNTWTKNCINKVLSCSAGQLGDGTIMRRPANYGLTAKPRLVAMPKRPNADMHAAHLPQK